MRIWSLHPKYLDSKGLVALWRETLLAKNVLEGKKKGYRNHPQLIRFKNQNPLGTINYYLSVVFQESLSRGYNFDSKKFKDYYNPIPLYVTNYQLLYEFEHLKKKLFVRNKEQYEKLKLISEPEPHPLFLIKNGSIESWEKSK